MDVNKRIKIGQRYFAIMIVTDDSEFYSLYTYKARGEEEDDWYSFFGITHDSERGWYFQR